MPGRLVVVATPIGNLGDLAPRAAEALIAADLVLAEDTRRTGRLLQHIGATTPQRSYHEHNERERIGEILEQLGQGATIALVTDAGTPGVSDPGYRLVAACAEAGIDVEAVPGPSAALHALVVSGLPTDRFVFEGFLPRKGAARTTRLDDLAAEPRTAILFLSPHRAGDDLRDLAAHLGVDRPAALCRELTKLHEEVRRGTLGELAEVAGTEPPRGEVTLVIQGAAPTTPERPSDEELVERVRALVATGLRKKAAIAQVAEVVGLPKREVYQVVVDAGG